MRSKDSSAHGFHSLSRFVYNHNVEVLGAKLPSPGRVTGGKHNLRLTQDALDYATLTLSVSRQGQLDTNASGNRTYSFRNALTSSHIFFLSRPLGALPFAPLPLPESTLRAASSSLLTSLAKAA